MALSKSPWLGRRLLVLSASVGRQLPLLALSLLLLQRIDQFHRGEEPHPFAVSFLWCVDAPKEVGIGGNICDGTGWDETCPMSEGLWRKFADWAIKFD